MRKLLKYLIPFLVIVAFCNAAGGSDSSSEAVSSCECSFDGTSSNSISTPGFELNAPRTSSLSCSGRSHVNARRTSSGIQRHLLDGQDGSLCRIMLLLAWVLLMFMCPFKTKSIELKIEGTSNASKRDKIIVSVIISNSAAANLIVPILAVVGTALLDDPTASQSFIAVGGLKTLVVGVVGFALGYGMLILIGF